MGPGIQMRVHNVCLVQRLLLEFANVNFVLQQVLSSRVPFLAVLYREICLIFKFKIGILSWLCLDQLLPISVFLLD